MDEKKLAREFDSALRKVVSAMYELQNVLEGNYQGVEEIICDAYPFKVSYEEQVAEVHAWLESVSSKVRAMGEGVTAAN
jgi:uncharacterized membrane protein